MVVKTWLVQEEFGEDAPNLHQDPGYSLASFVLNLSFRMSCLSSLSFLYRSIVKKV